MILNESARMVAFFGSVSGMGILGEIDPSSAVGELAKGSAQTVLAAICVAQAWALYKIFTAWRQDVKEQQTVAASMNQKVADSLAEFTKTIGKCEGPDKK